MRENLLRLIVEPDARLEDEVSAYLLSEIPKITNTNEVFSALAEGYSRYTDILAQSHVSSGATLVNVLGKLIEMQLVQKRAPINDPGNRRKTSYVVVDGLSSFYYCGGFRYLWQRRVLDSNAFYEAKFRATPVTQSMVEDEIAQVERTGLACYRYGFIPRSGFAAQPDERTVFIGLGELYR